MKMSKVALELKRREKSRIANLIKKYDKRPRDFQFDPAGFRDNRRRGSIRSPQSRCTSCGHLREKVTLCVKRRFNNQKKSEQIEQVRKARRAGLLGADRAHTW